MKLSELQADDVLRYGRFEQTADDISPDELLAAAKSFAIGYTGLSLDELDQYEDVTIAVLALCVDLYENRTMSIEEGNLNRTVSSILSMHCRNFL